MYFYIRIGNKFRELQYYTGNIHDSIYPLKDHFSQTCFLYEEYLSRECAIYYFVL